MSILVGWFPDTFDERWIWAAPLLTLLGGGSMSMNAIVFASITDLTTDQFR